MLGFVGALLGIVAGLGVGVALAALVAGDGAAIPLEIPWPTIGFAAVFGVGVAIAASWYPARLAGEPLDRPGREVRIAPAALCRPPGGHPGEAP